MDIQLCDKHPIYTFFTVHNIIKKCIKTIDFRGKDRHFINLKNFDKILFGYLDYLTACAKKINLNRGG